MQEEKIQPHLSENVITVITDPNELRSLNINGDYGLSYQIDGMTDVFSHFIQQPSNFQGVEFEQMYQKNFYNIGIYHESNNLDN